MKIVPVILSGGSGTRLWPLSRKQYPKQYLPLVGDNTMLQETILRLNGLDNLADPVIVCNADHRFLVAEQCQQINIKNPTILLEPIGRNTAPAIATAAFQAQKTSEDSILLVLSADHVIKNVDEFHKAIDIAFKQAQQGKLATFGIVPTEANTGYGYIKSAINEIDGAYQVEEFVEKPDAKTAKSYIEQGNYLWNSGMFMFQTSTLINELSEYSPNIVMSVIDAVRKSKQDLDFIRLDEKSFKSSPSDSIDYALMEKSNNVVVVPLDAQWSDVGSWSALYNIGEKDNNGNVTNGDVITQDTTNTYINANHHMVTTIGVDNLIVVDTPDATFITTQDKAQEVKSIVESLQASGRCEGAAHRKVYRPWGWYDSIESGEHFQVKRLHVNPGEKLSLQMHYKRSEYWVIVSGVATVTNGDQELTLTKGQSTYIPLKTVHCLENQTDEPLEIIEVQSGEYLGEDDIIRFHEYSTISHVFNNELIEHSSVMGKLPLLTAEIKKSSEMIINCLRNGGRIFIAGNGGSAADSQHLAAEIVVRYKKNRNPLPAISLTTDSSVLTAIANDYSFDDVFSRQLIGLSSERDLFIGISTSGQSKNILKAIKTAANLGLKTILLTGLTVNKSNNIDGLTIKAPSTNTARIQEAHIFIIHYWCEEIDACDFTKETV